MIYSLFKPLIFKLNPETAHNLAIFALKNNLLLGGGVKSYSRLESKILGQKFYNPIGMAAGFDKNAAAITNLFKFGFGFVEVGTVTPKAQEGNAKPRIFRLEKDQAIINRLGFNNLGIKNFLSNISGQKLTSKQILGINIGKNKDTQNAIEDYVLLLEKTYGKSNYITINISSPNTKNLRDLQQEEQLDGFLAAIMAKKQLLQQKTQKNVPILLKIAPDLSENEQKVISDLALKHQIDGLIISNTTISRPENLQDDQKTESGGLSGAPILEISNKVLANIYQKTNGKIPIIAGGGIKNATDAYEKIKLGASLVQIYSAFIYQGFVLVEKVKKELDELLKQDGFENFSQAVGVKNSIRNKE
jgi:dihydroorotate dehydrogenase